MDDTEEYSKTINGNTILLSLEGWIKYIQGFIKGLQTTDTVNTSAVLECINEIFEYMISFRKQLMTLFIHCEEILQENEKLKKQIEELTILKLEDKESEDL